MRTTRNILLGLTALIIGVSALQAGNNAQKTRKSGSGEWVSIGPVDVPGRVLAIHVDNDDNMRIYAGTAGGGLWISVNGGASWSHCKGFQGSAAVSAITQASNGRLFIGTGEGLNWGYAPPGVKNNLGTFGITGDGVYISDDKGATFTQIASTASWIEVNTMAYDKKNNWLYVGTNEGLKVSKDNGTTFQNAMSGPGSTSKVFDVKVGSDGSVICAIFPSNGDVRISTDNGTTFTSVCGTRDTLLPNTAGRFSVAIAPSNPDVMYAFATDNASGRQGRFLGLFVSTNKGKSWRRIFHPNGYDDPMRGYGAYSNVIAVSPDDFDKVFVGSYNLYQVTKSDSTQVDIDGKRLYAPLPSGRYWVGDPNLSSSYLARATDIHSIFYSGKTIYLGTASGIYCSTSDGALFLERNRALSNTQIFSMSVGVNSRIIAGTRENGSVFMRNPKNWDAHSEGLSDGHGGKSAFSSLKPDALHYVTYDYDVYRRASFESDAQGAAQWLTANGEENCIMGRGAEFPRWATSDDDDPTSVNASRLAVPLLFWESANDANSKDTIRFVADKNYKPGERICAKSARNKYPVWTTNTTGDTLRKDSVFYVLDSVTSRLFLGGGGFAGGSTVVGAPVFMSLTALNYDISQRWNCVFHTNEKSEQVIDMAVSRDGNHLFILTKATGGSAIYRVSGFDDYRALKEVDKFNYDYAKKSGYEGSVGGLFTSNPLRMLTDETLLTTMDDILSIALDPNDDDNLIYTTGESYDRIMLITNATTVSSATPVNKEGSGLPNNVPVYTGLIVKKKGNDNSSNIAYIGTEVGIYRTENFYASNPKWEEYIDGIGIKVPVFKLHQQTKDMPFNYSLTYDGSDVPDSVHFSGTTNLGIIYAATHGAGIYMDITYFVPPITGIKPYLDITQDNKLKVYPNPATSSVSVDYALQSNQSVQLNIVDIMGRVVYTENLGTKESGSHSQLVDCSNLPNGFYIINMVIGKQTKTAKFVIFK